MEEKSPDLFSELLALVSFAAVVAIVLFQTNTYFAEKGVDGGGARENAALFPELMSYGILALGGMLLVQLFFRRRATEATEEGAPSEQSMLPQVCFFSTLIIYFLLLGTLGYHILTPTVLFVQFWLLGIRNPLKAAGIAIATSLAVSIVFEGFLNVVLPVGVFEIALPF